MFGLRLPVAAAASLALAGLILSAPLASAASVYQPNGNAYVPGVHGYGPSHAYSHYRRGNESVFPNTEDHSSECINGYRWQRHTNDWNKTTAEDTIPLRCN